MLTDLLKALEGISRKLPAQPHRLDRHPRGLRGDPCRILGQPRQFLRFHRFPRLFRVRFRDSGLPCVLFRKHIQKVLFRRRLLLFLRQLQRRQRKPQFFLRQLQRRQREPQLLLRQLQQRRQLQRRRCEQEFRRLQRRQQLLLLELQRQPQFRRRRTPIVYSPV